jgi:hypothetical protein
MATKLIPTAYHRNRLQQSVYMRIAILLLGKDIIAGGSGHATTDELFDALFYMRFAFCQKMICKSFFPEYIFERFVALSDEHSLVLPQNWMPKHIST